MHFDTSPRTLRSLNSIMRSDPRVIRWTMLKLGEKIEDVVQDREVTVDRTDERGTGPRSDNSLKFMGKMGESRPGFGDSIGLGGIP
jgi:hypothetical protein